MKLTKWILQTFSPPHNDTFSKRMKTIKIRKDLNIINNLPIGQEINYGKN